MGLNSEFESIVETLTQPINGQYPRPWMTTLLDPSRANVFVVGMNQAKTFKADMVGAHGRYLDALFNRNGQSLRGLYNEVSKGRPSPTRQNTDAFVSCLIRHGIDRVLETNVICYSTPMSKDLRLPLNIGGSKRGEIIFRTLLHYVRPRVLIVHGAGATKQLAQTLSLRLPPPNPDAMELVHVRTDDQLILVMPSLAPPEFNKWSKRAPASEVFEKISRYMANELSK